MMGVENHIVCFLKISETNTLCSIVKRDGDGGISYSTTDIQIGSSCSSYFADFGYDEGVGSDYFSTKTSGSGEYKGVTFSGSAS